MADALCPARLGLAAFAAAALAAGCTPEGEFPSLEPRAAELADPLEEPVRTPQAVAAEPALGARTAELAGEARRGERAFDAAFPSAAAATRASGAHGSESWIAAQQAISALEAARAPTTAALAELDRLAVERANQPTNEEDFAAIRTALDEAGRIAAGQQRRLDGLRGAIRR